jgi:hypothetical protein
MSRWNDINGVGLPYEKPGFLFMVSDTVNSWARVLFLIVGQRASQKQIESPALLYISI